MKVKKSCSTVPSSLPCAAVSRLVGHDGPVQAIRFTADGKYCVTGGVDRTVRLWNPARLDPAFAATDVTAAAPAPYTFGGNSRLGGGAGDGVAVDALPRGLPIQVYRDGITHAVSSVAVDEESTQFVAACDKNLVLVDLMTGQVKRRFQGHLGRINAVAISAGCETYLSASYDATVRIWDGRSRSHEPIQILKDAKDSVTDVHVIQTPLSGGGNKNNNNNKQALIRTASVDGMVRTYDLRKGVMRCDDCSYDDNNSGNNHRSPVTSIATTRDEHCMVASCLDGTIRLLDSGTGQLLNTFHSHHTAGQYGLQCAVTADDNYVVTGSEDGKVVYYDLVRATSVQSLLGHEQPTCALAAHPQKTSVLVSSSYDGNVIVWAHEQDSNSYFLR